MKTNLLFDFTVDKNKRTISVKREFDADVKLVWKAWTTPELLDQWWGPRPWKAETKTMNFREGGYWLYAMVGPGGEKHWSRADYLSISPERSFTAKDAFCDEDGELHPDFNPNLWESQFTPQEKQTLVSVLLTFDRLEDLEKTIEMGFQEGFTAGLGQLEELLGNFKNS